MNKKKPILIAFVVMLLWGLLFPMVKLGFSAYNIVSTGDILFFAGVRFTVCGAVISLYALLTDAPSYKGLKSAWGNVLLSGLFAIILHYAFTYIGLSFTDSSKTAILKQIGALIYVCFSFVFFKSDKPTVAKILGALLGFAGVIAINLDGNGIKFGIGDFLIIAASFCTVASNIVSKKALVSVKPITMTGVSQLFGGIILLVIGHLLGGRMTFSLDTSYIMVCICIASIVSYCLWFTVVKDGALSNLFIIKFAEPAFACVFGALILGENILRLQYLLAFVLISAGIYIANRKSPFPIKEKENV